MTAEQLKYITIDGFEQLSKQQIFDMASSHIISTGEQSTKWDVCSYSGSGCAASPFIKEGFHEKADQFGCWHRVAAAGLASLHEVSFMQKIQACHDEWRGHDDGTTTTDFMIYWREQMEELAGFYMLDSSIFEMKEHCNEIHA